MKSKTLSTIFTALALLTQLPAAAHPQTHSFTPNSPTSFSVFSLPQNIGGPVNSGDSENAAFVAPNGLSLYFSSNAPGTLGSIDLWVSQRPTPTSAWAAPQNLGAIINTAGVDNMPALSADGLTMFFNSSGRPDTLGGADIYMTTRTNPNDDFGWTAPVNLGTIINTSANEIGAGYFEDKANGTAILYFSSDRAGGLGGEDIYQSTRTADGTFNPPTNVAALNSISEDRRAQLRRDGLEVLFDSDRSGSDGRDIYVSTRASVLAEWNPPVNLATVNSSANDQHPSLSSDGSILYLVSSRDGSLDIYTAVRTSVNRTATADFDGDGRADISVFRPSDGTWHILNSGTNTYSVQPFGANGDKITPGDYDGDSRTDFAVFRPSTGDWWINKSSDGSVSTFKWGISTDKPVPADYDGDGRTDIAVYRNGTWYIVQSSNGSLNYQQFGLASDVPITGVQ
ncbi:MAG: FG-GAP-like repeat-containing protein [Acidobacteriota bacterium]